MKILVFVDPSHRGEWALCLAQDLAAALADSIILLTTNENLAADPKILDRAAERISAQAKNAKIEKRVRPGLAREAIIEESQAARPAISIVPPAGRSGLARWLKGSRIKTVLQGSPSTVLVARKPVSDHIQSVLVTVSGGPMSETTALCALEIAQALHAQLTLLHVSSSVHIPFGDANPTPAPRNLTPIRDLLRKGGIDPRMRAREGMVVNEILHECETGGYDLLILGQHLVDMEAGGPFSENIAEVLAIECPIPVLVVRPRRWAAGNAADEETEVPARPA